MSTQKDWEDYLFFGGKMPSMFAGKVAMPKGFEHVTDFETEYTPDGIPNSWLDDQGIRHAVIWESGLDEYMRLEKRGGKWVLLENAPF